MEKRGLVEKIREWVRDPIILILFASGLIALVIIIVFVINALGPDKWGEKIKVDNIDVITDLSGEDKNQIFASLHSFARSSNPDDVKMPKSGAMVRETTISRYFDTENNADAVDFVVDIEELRQSYLVTHWFLNEDSSEYLKNFGANNVQCVKKDQLIYEDFGCVAPDNMNDSLSEKDRVFVSLPYFGETESGVSVSIIKRQYLGGDDYLEVDVTSCGDKKIIAEGETFAKNWVKSLGANPEEFEFQVMDLCDEEW